LARHFQNFDAPAEQGQYAIQPGLEIERGKISCFSAAFKSMKLATMSASVGIDSMLRWVDELPRRLGQQLHAPAPFRASLAASFDFTLQKRGLLVRLYPRHQEGSRLT